MKYCYSTDEDNFTGMFSTREEAEAEIPDGGWTAEIALVPLALLCNGHGEDIAERLHERLADHCGEAAGSFMPTKAEVGELEKVVATAVAVWLGKVGINCYGVDNVERYTPTPEAE